MGCDSKKEITQLKSTVQNKLGDKYQIMEPKTVEPKLKIFNVEEDDMKLKDEDIIEMLIRKNKLERERRFANENC